MGVYIGLKEKRRKKPMREKPGTIKIFVEQDDLPDDCGAQCLQHCAKVLRVELHDFYTGYLFDVKIGKGADDYTRIFDVEKPEDVMDVTDSMLSYIENIIDSPEKWCQCNKEEE